MKGVKEEGWWWQGRKRALSREGQGGRGSEGKGKGERKGGGKLKRGR